MINELATLIYEINVENGFYVGQKNIGESLCLIHSEVSEALECDRKDKYVKPGALNKTSGLANNEDFKASFQKNIKDTFEDELADIIIRVLDLAAYKQINIHAHIKAKVRYNSLREYQHGKKY